MRLCLYIQTLQIALPNAFLTSLHSWKLEPWSKSPYFYTVDFDSHSTSMASVTVPHH